MWVFLFFCRNSCTHVTHWQHLWMLPCPAFMLLLLFLLSCYRITRGYPHYLALNSRMYLLPWVYLGFFFFVFYTILHFIAIMKGVSLNKRGHILWLWTNFDTNLFVFSIDTPVMITIYALRFKGFLLLCTIVFSE